MKRLAICVLAVLSFFALWADDADSIAFANANWQKFKLKKGATARVAQFELFGSRQSIQIITFNPRRFKMILVQTDELTKTSETATRYDAEFAINAGFWNVKQVVPATFLKIEGNVIMPQTEARELNRVNGLVAFGKRGIEVIECDTANYNQSSAPYANVIASGPVLIDNGKQFNYPNNGGFFGRHPRSLIGRTKKGTVVMVTIDGRFKGEAEGMTIEELVKISQWLGLEDALNLDGGGSSTLWTKQYGIINNPCDNRTYDHEGERRVSSVILAK